MPRVTMQPEQRRQAIVDAARKLFAERGYADVRMSDVSDALGVSQGLPYRYFDSKLDLYAAVAENIGDEMMAEIETVTFAPDENASRKLDHLFEAFTPFALQTRLFGEFHKEEHSLLHAQIAMEKNQRLVPLLAALIEEGNADGSFHCPNPHYAAAFILQGLSGTGDLAPIRGDESEDAIREQINTIRLFVGRIVGESTT